MKRANDKEMFSLASVILLFRHAKKNIYIYMEWMKMEKMTRQDKHTLPKEGVSLN